MPVNSEFSNFLQGWMNKAMAIPLTDLNSHFDSFFTLFVIYNRLYAEATFILGRQEQIDLQKRKHFPDGQAATSYLAKFLGAINIINAIEGNDLARNALGQVKQLIHSNRFSIKLNLITGDRQRNADLELLSGLESDNCNKKANAILETLYAVRCNMFHGNKGFNSIQMEILSHILVILATLIDIIRQKIEIG